MAAKKKTTTEPTVKTYTLTEEQFKTLEKIYEKLSDVRRNLGGLEGEENVSTIMFKVGSVFNNADWCEDEIRDIINSFDEDNCDDCEDDNF
jgi:DNA-binding PadR family transcriptional regulator